jgi:DNA mismatch repair protein MutL
MPKINILTEDLINKIAAGEVIERPSSVVKELIENSLDSGATKINIIIKDSGKRLIKVTDNGEGMDESDARNSILRHTTSKIKTDEDLFSINTLGFRGEALASIAAISQMSITTKQQGEVEGFNIAIEGGGIISSGPIASEEGTSIEIRNIFFNTPARKKFLKTDPVELRHIVDTVIRYALINHKVSFRLDHDGHNLLNSPAVDDPRNNIAAIYGVGLAKDLMKVNYESDSIKVSGYIANPLQARNDKSQQAIFVNKRWVRNDDISKAVYDAYHSLLFLSKHPVLVLNIEIDPKKIDVNVHPNKSEVKIEQKDHVYKAVFEAIKFTLQKNNLVPVLDSSDEQLTFGATRKEKVVDRQKYQFEPSKQATFKVKSDLELEQIKPVKSDLDVEFYSTPEEDVYVAKEKVISESVKFPAMKLLGQIHKTFFVAETLGGLYYIDQHAAHERVLYEKFMKQYMERGIEVQKLLQGEVLEFSPSEKLLIQDSKIELERLGFTLEGFGGNSYLIKTIPLLFGRQQPKEVIYDVLTFLKDGKQKISETKEEIVTRMSCRAAVMAGENLTLDQMEKILKELSQTEFPYTCPHGRPSIIKIPVTDLNRMFKRI